MSLKMAVVVSNLLLYCTDIGCLQAYSLSLLHLLLSTSPVADIDAVIYSKSIIGSHCPEVM